MSFQKHIIHKHASVRDALLRLDDLAADAILFVADDDNKLEGSLTDGDIRRGIIKGFSIDDNLSKYIKLQPIYIQRNKYSLEQLEEYKKKDLKVIPMVDDDNVIVDVVNFRLVLTVLPVDVLLMAGGKGERLMPLTANTPKPLLKVGDKPIIEHNIDRLAIHGVKKMHISINYLGEQLVDYFNNASKKEIDISYIKEDKPLGTIGSIMLIDNFTHDDVLVMNSDLLTNIDFADFYRTYKNSGADMAIATTSYNVEVPYAVLEVDKDNFVSSLKEKPKYTYFSNAGIYLIKRHLLDLIPSGDFYNITDLMEDMLKKRKLLATYPIVGYWLDIGRHEDFIKAQVDIKHISLL